jgi:hypothetical protein
MDLPYKQKVFVEMYEMKICCRSCMQYALHALAAHSIPYHATWHDDMEANFSVANDFSVICFSLMSI